MEQEVQRHVIEQQSGDDLVDREAQAQDRRQQHPHEPAKRGRREHEDQAKAFGAEIRRRHPGREDRAEDHLPFDADIPEPDLESDAGGQPGDEQRRRLDEDGGKAARARKDRHAEFLHERGWRDSGENKHQRSLKNSGRKPGGEHERLLPERHVLANFETKSGEPPLRCPAFRKASHGPPWRARSHLGPPARRIRQRYGRGSSRRCGPKGA